MWNNQAIAKEQQHPYNLKSLKDMLKVTSCEGLSRGCFEKTNKKSL